MFDSKRVHWGHPHVYTDNDIQLFDTNYQKQLLFNFCATRASKKKSALINEACASRLCDIDLNIIPTTFSHDTTDWHELSQYVLEDVLTCPVGCCLSVCICAGANGNPDVLFFWTALPTYRNTDFINEKNMLGTLPKVKNNTLYPHS